MGIHSKVWGQYLWRLLHSLTYSYNPKLPENIKSKYARLFHVLKDFIPCPICRNHYTGRCNRNPPERNMNSTNQFTTWLSNLHNEVNIGLGKPTVSKRQSDLQYIKNGKLTYNFRDFVVLFRIITMINYVNYPAVQKFIQLTFEIYPENLLTKNAPNSYKTISSISDGTTLNIWIQHFDIEFAKNRKLQPYLTNPSIVPRIVEDRKFAKENQNFTIRHNITSSNSQQVRQQPVKNSSKIIKNDIDVFLKKYKII